MTADTKTPEEILQDEIMSNPFMMADQINSTVAINAMIIYAEQQTIKLNARICELEEQLEDTKYDNMERDEKRDL